MEDRRRLRPVHVRVCKCGRGVFPGRDGHLAGRGRAFDREMRRYFHLRDHGPETRLPAAPGREEQGAVRPRAHRWFRFYRGAFCLRSSVYRFRPAGCRKNGRYAELDRGSGGLRGSRPSENQTGILTTIVSAGLTYSDVTFILSKKLICGTRDCKWAFLFSPRRLAMKRLVFAVLLLSLAFPAAADEK